MNGDLAGIVAWAPAFVLVLGRVGAAMMFLPGLGETTAPTVVRVGLALALTVLLLPEIQPAVASPPDAGMTLALMVAGEVVTGMWFGWVARMLVLALPIAMQLATPLMGLSSVLQPDSELGAQSSALGKLYELAMPVVILATGMYRLPVAALHGLFELIPPGHMLPVADSAQTALRAVAAGFALALQLAAPFVAIAIVWHLAIGLVARIVTRMQIYFVAMPGQILGGMVVLTGVSGVILLSWRSAVGKLLLGLPGAH